MTDDNYYYPWIWRRQPFTEQHLATGRWFGFCYRITNEINGKFYLGRKYFIHRKKGKTVQSDWANYWGSSVYLLEDIMKYGKQNFSRFILSLHKTRGATNFSETELLFRYKVIEDVNCYNKSILGKYSRINRTQSIYDERI